MHEPIDLISHAALRELRSFTNRTRQPTRLEMLDLAPMEHVHEIEITEEHVTILYNQKITNNYNTNEITQKEWIYKYNDDPEFVQAVRAVIELARKHLRDMPDNIACPPGCAECCSGYEPFVSRPDVQRIADHLGMTYTQVMNEYVVKRPSADGFHVGWLRKVTDDLSDNCVFLKGSKSGRYYCGIYEARPHDCADFTPIGCEDVDETLSHRGTYKVGPAFKPNPRRRSRR